MSDSSLKNKFNFILVEPSHPGNIGATARAIKNMGFTNLSLINPKDFPNDDAFYRAKGAKDILENIKIYEDLSDALKDATLIFGTSARTRTIPWPTKTSSELSIVLKKALESGNAKVDHFDQVMKKMDFYDQENPKQVKTRMRRLIKRLQPDKLETGILRGFLAKIEQILNKKN